MPISSRGFAAGLNAIARALEEMEIVGGHILWSANNVPRLIIDGNGAIAGTSGSGLWAIATSGASFTLSNCLYRRMEVSKMLADIEGEVMQDGEAYIAAWINSESGTATAQVGVSIAAVTDAESNPESDYYKILLYKVSRVTKTEGEENVVTLSVLNDYRAAPFVGLYV